MNEDVYVFDNPNTQQRQLIKGETIAASLDSIELEVFSKIPINNRPRAWFPFQFEPFIPGIRREIATSMQTKEDV